MNTFGSVISIVVAWLLLSGLCAFLLGGLMRAGKGR